MCAFAGKKSDRALVKKHGAAGTITRKTIRPRSCSRSRPHGSAVSEPFTCEKLSPRKNALHRASAVKSVAELSAGPCGAQPQYPQGALRLPRATPNLISPLCPARQGRVCEPLARNALPEPPTPPSVRFGTAALPLQAPRLAGMRLQERSRAAIRRGGRKRAQMPPRVSSRAHQHAGLIGINSDETTFRQNAHAKCDEFQGLCAKAGQSRQSLLRQAERRKTRAK